MTLLQHALQMGLHLEPNGKKSQFEIIREATGKSPPEIVRELMATPAPSWEEEELQYAEGQLASAKLEAAAAQTAFQRAEREFDACPRGPQMNLNKGLELQRVFDAAEDALSAANAKVARAQDELNRIAASWSPTR